MLKSLAMMEVHLPHNRYVNPIRWILLSVFHLPSYIMTFRVASTRTLQSRDQLTGYTPVIGRVRHTTEDYYFMTRAASVQYRDVPLLTFSSRPGYLFCSFFVLFLFERFNVLRSPYRVARLDMRSLKKSRRLAEWPILSARWSPGHFDCVEISFASSSLHQDILIPRQIF